MGIMGPFLGKANVVRTLGETARDLSEVFFPNATKKMEHENQAFISVLNGYKAEFMIKPTSWFDRFVNALNRLPRPFLALGTIALFIYAMADPEGFSHRMQGLSYVPEPLWWLLGAVVAFYFGAREMHHIRYNPSPIPWDNPKSVSNKPDRLERNAPMLSLKDVLTTGPNAALEEWQEMRSAG